jgi:hypothetical protein
MISVVRVGARRARRLALVLGTGAMLGAFGGATPASAQGAWCAYYGTGGASNCGFYTYEQCRAAISGIGGKCLPSPWVEREPRRKDRRAY